MTEEQDEFFKLLDQAQRMSQQIQGISGETIEASSGGGVVKIVATPSLEIRSVHIDPSVIDPSDPGLLEDLVLAAIRDVIEQAGERGRRMLDSSPLSDLASIAGSVLSNSGANDLSQMLNDLLGGMFRTETEPSIEAQRSASPHHHAHSKEISISEAEEEEGK